MISGESRLAIKEEKQKKGERICETANKHRKHWSYKEGAERNYMSNRFKDIAIKGKKKGTYGSKKTKKVLCEHKQRGHKETGH